jgi:hypothetical protein
MNMLTPVAKMGYVFSLVIIAVAISKGGPFLFFRIIQVKATRFRTNQTIPLATAIV